MRKLILVVVDGLSAGLFEQALGDSRLPALSFLAEHGRLGRAVSTFPSLTPVCLSSLATGRSEERRVGKECRGRGWPDQEQEKIRTRRGARPHKTSEGS